MIGGKQGKRRDGDLLLFRSTDSGRTWGYPIAVNDQPDTAREGLHAMAASIKGELTCAWLDLATDKTEVYSATSTDGGKNWSKNVLVYRSPSGSVCECCHPSVAYSQDGKVHVMWRNSLAGKRDMYCAVSSDGGNTFGKAQKLGSGSWSLDHCPMDGGSISVLADGTTASVWQRDKTVYLFGSGSSKEVQLGSGEQPWLAASAKGPVEVWLRKRGAALMLRQPGTSRPIKLAKAARDPVIASGGPKTKSLSRRGKIQVWVVDESFANASTCIRRSHAQRHECRSLIGIRLNSVLSADQKTTHSREWTDSRTGVSPPRIVSGSGHQSSHCAGGRVSETR